MGQVKEGCVVPVLLAARVDCDAAPGLCLGDGVKACSETDAGSEGAAEVTHRHHANSSSSSNRHSNRHRHRARQTPRHHQQEPPPPSKLPPFQQSVTLTSLMRSMVNKAANLIG